MMETGAKIDSKRDPTSNQNIQKILIKSMLKYDTKTGHMSWQRRGSGGPFKPFYVPDTTIPIVFIVFTQKKKKTTDKKDTPLSRQSRKRGGG